MNALGLKNSPSQLVEDPNKFNNKIGRVSLQSLAWPAETQSVGLQSQHEAIVDSKCIESQNDRKAPVTVGGVRDMRAKFEVIKLVILANIKMQNRLIDSIDSFIVFDAFYATGNEAYKAKHGHCNVKNIQVMISLLVQSLKK